MNTITIQSTLLQRLKISQEKDNELQLIWEKTKDKRGSDFGKMTKELYVSEDIIIYQDMMRLKTRYSGRDALR
jgi:hypothetical protein